MRAYTITVEIYYPNDHASEGEIKSYDHVGVMSSRKGAIAASITALKNYGVNADEIEWIVDEKHHGVASCSRLSIKVKFDMFMVNKINS